MKCRHIIFFILLLLAACSGQGTEVGNPSTTRNVTGTFSATNVVGLRKLNLDAAQVSCAASAGAVSVVFRTLAGDEVSTEIGSDLSISSSLEKSSRYEVLFEQNGTACGYLIYGADQPQAGLRVALGQGSLDIDFGEVTDLGNGLFVSLNNPSDSCDDDSDDLSDTDDNDDDGDGNIDDDGDFDGYIDWFDDNEDDGSDDDSTVSGSAGCTIDQIYPSSSSGFELDDVGMGELEITLTADIAGVDADAIMILDSSGTIVVNGIDNEDYEITDSDQKFVGQVTLSPAEDYTLQIPAGAFTCNDGTSTEESVDVDFFTYEDN